VIRWHVPDTAYCVVLFGSRSAGERSDMEIWIEGPAPVSRAALAALPRSADFRVALAERDLVLAGQHQFAALAVEAAARVTTPIERSLRKCHCPSTIIQPRKVTRYVE
jgi:hypothetical protein